jgi:hypothetical protein
MSVVAYRHAAYDTPWWAFPSSRDGRFHRATEDTVQYLALHPFGPAAEMLRHNVGPSGDPDDLVLNLWAVDIDVEAVVRVDFDSCAALGLAPEELVGEDYAPTQQLAADVSATGVPGMVVPSAALPGTDNLILFGPRVACAYLGPPFSLDEIPTGHLSDGARVSAEIAGLVRWMGTPHTTLQHWRATGATERLVDPLATRW